MGMNLRLLPFDNDDGDRNSYSHTILETGQRYDLYDKIRALEKKFDDPVPKRFNSFVGTCEKCEETHYGTTEDTPYGDRLNCVRLKDLLTLKDDPEVLDHPKNVAVWAYLEAMANGPDSRQEGFGKYARVALHWH